MAFYLDLATYFIEYRCTSIHNIHTIEHKYKIAELYIRDGVIKNVMMCTDIGYYTATRAVFYAITTPPPPPAIADTATLSHCIIVYGLKIKF